MNSEKRARTWMIRRRTRGLKTGNKGARLNKQHSLHAFDFFRQGFGRFQTFSGVSPASSPDIPFRPLVRLTPAKSCPNASGQDKARRPDPVAMSSLKLFPILAPQLADGSGYRLPAHGFTARLTQVGRFPPVSFQQLLHPKHKFL